VAGLLTPLTVLESVPVGRRLTFFNLLKGLGETSSSLVTDLDSNKLAELYKTQHEVQQFLPLLSVEQSDLESDVTKHRLFCRLLEESCTTDQAVRVYKLIGEWEGFEANTLDSDTDNCVLRMALRVLEIDKRSEILLEVLGGVDESNLPNNVAKSLLSKLDDGNKDLELKLVLTLAIEQKYENLLQSLAKQTVCDTTLATLLVERGLACKLVTSPLYPHLVKLVSDVEGEKGEQLMESLTQQLREAGYGPQAASLQMVAEGLPVALRTMAAVAQRFLRR